MTQQPGGSNNDNIVSAVCYILGPFAAVFLFIAPYSTNKAVRFHVFQALFLSVAVIAVFFLLGALASALYFVPLIGWTLYTLIGFFNLVVFGVAVLLAVLAYQGRSLEVPVVSQLARQMG